MDIESCIQGRRSIRAFRPDPVDDSIITDALGMANQAPSAGNLQARDFIVVKDAATKGLFRRDGCPPTPINSLSDATADSNERRETDARCT